MKPTQLSFVPSDRDRPVNVASVPLRSPFRYPGGKTWLVPTLRAWLGSQTERPTLLIEPFLGGGISSLTAVFEQLVERAIMVELDDAVADVWETVLSGDNEWLAERILGFDMQPDTLDQELSRPGETVRERAFQTILRNRTYHGGIMAPGSGQLKYGESGRGVRSRWYPKTIATRIRDIWAVAERLAFIRGDGMKIMADYAAASNAVFFIDPPYTAAGKRAGSRLYTHYELDHEKLFGLAAGLTGDFLMTYDNANEIVKMAQAQGFDFKAIPMRNTHHAEMTELIIGRDLGWARTDRGFFESGGDSV